MKYPKNTDKRRSRYKEQKKMFILSVEGPTERDYFNHYKKLYKDTIVIDILKKKDGESSPLQVLNRMETELEKKELDADDEAWLVFDYDNRKNSEFAPLVKWKHKNHKHGIAVSVRDFEYWKILHFEDGDKFGSDHKKYHQKLADYLEIPVDHLKKQNRPSILMKHFTKENFEQAIIRAKRRKSNTEETDWPNKDFSHFNSDVCLLAEKIVNA